MNPNELPLKDIRPLILLDDRIPWWQWALIVVAAVLVIVLVRTWWRQRRKQAGPKTPPAKIIDPYEHFFSQVATLDQLLDQPTEYCFELSRILREFIENRYGFRATDRTSEEILVEIRRLYAFSENDLTTLRTFFNRVDPVRYAKQLPTRSELNELRQEIVALVKKQHKPGDSQEQAS